MKLLKQYVLVLVIVNCAIADEPCNNGTCRSVTDESPSTTLSSETTTSSLFTTTPVVTTTSWSTTSPSMTTTSESSPSTVVAPLENTTSSGSTTLPPQTTLPGVSTTTFSVASTTVDSTTADSTTEITTTYSTTSSPVTRLGSAAINTTTTTSSVTTTTSTTTEEEEMYTTVVPTAMNMLSDEDEHYGRNMGREERMEKEEIDEMHMSTAPPFLPTVPAPTESGRARAINFTLEEHHTENNISPNASDVTTKKDFKDLSDVSMDDDEDDIQKHPVLSKLADEGNHTLGICITGGLTYSHGEKIEDGCESVCTCMHGKMQCQERCVVPFFRRGKKIEDPLCAEKAVEDPCCSIMVCEADTETEPFEMCTHQNKTYHRGDKFEDGCSQICVCESGGKLNCKPRCHPINKTSDRCVEVPDPSDSCCKMILCDVSLDDHEHKDHDAPKAKLVSAKYVNATTIGFTFDIKLDDKFVPDVEISTDKEQWITYKLIPGGYLTEMKPNFKYARVENTEDYVEVQNRDSSINNDVKKDEIHKACVDDGKTYKTGEEFYKNCTSFCICLETGIKCLKIQCPTYFGLDAVDPTCLEWETVPKDFVPKAPNCCPQEVKCKSNGSCIHEGQMYHNWQELPSNVTGCDKRCYCEMGKVECQSACPPVQAAPPATLPCPSHEATLEHLPDDDCCMAWTCSRQPPPGFDDKTSKKTDKPRLDNTNNKPFFPTSSPPIINTTHQTSKFEGPLLIYENDKPSKSKNKTAAFSPFNPNNSPIHPDDNNNEPNLKPDLVDKYKNTKPEGPIYEHSLPWPVGPSRNPTKPTKEEVSIKPIPDIKPPSFISPFNPDAKPAPPVKTKKGNKTNSNNANKQKDQFLPPLVSQQIPYDPQNPHYQNIQNPEEILQIINQHPELANYPPGAVFEIHNFPQDIPQKPEYNIPQNKFPPSRKPPPQHQPPHVPYLINQIDPNTNYASNLPIDQIIKHVQEGQIPPGLPRPAAPSYAQNSQFSQNPMFAQPGLQYSVLNNQPQLNQTTGFGGFPGRFPNVPGFQQSPDEINVHQVEAIDGQTVRLIFTVSQLIVGLHGRVEVRYTSRQDDNIATWELQVFAPPNDLIATQQLEFDLIGLEPNTEYKIKITVILRDLHNTPTSRIYSVRTPASSAFTTMPPMIPIEPNLAITDVNSTWANVVWRKLTDFELQFVDGVQLRFKEITGKVYAATPLIHRAVTAHMLENLKPDTEYEIGIFFIPFTGQNTELHAENKVHFTTSSEIDPYGFNVTLEIQLVKATTVDVAWSGVPYPEDKYVNIYRAIYQSDSGKGDSSTFKIAKRDSPKKTTILELKPGTRYRLWLEVYLTNGKIKTSNVQDFVTKPRTAPALGASTQQGKLSTEVTNQSNDYYGPLVIVAILAAIAILSTLILLMILFRRHSQQKASISTPSRVSQSAYDNPTYKVEIQQETMGL